MFARLVVNFNFDSLYRFVRVGDRPTTLTDLGYLYFAKRRFLRKRTPDRAFVIPSPSDAQPLPFELTPGALWRGIAIQDADIEAWATTGILDMMLYHSHNQKPLRRRVVIKKRKRETLNKAPG